MMHTYGRVMRYVIRQWPTLLLILGLTVVASTVTALQPWPVKILVDYALGNAAIPVWLHFLFERISLSLTPIALVIIAALGSLGLFALNSALDITLNLSWSVAGQRMVYDLAGDLFHRLQRLSLLFHVRHTVGDSLSRLTDDTYVVYKLAQNLLISPLRSIFTLMILGAIAWRFDRGLTILSLALAPIMSIIALLLGNRLKKLHRESREAHSRLLSFVHQTLTAIPVVQAFGTEARNQRNFHFLSDDAVVISKRSSLVYSAYGLANGLTRTVGIAFVLFFGGLQVLAGELTVGSLLLFLGYISSIQRSVNNLLEIYGDLKTAEASIDRVNEILSNEEMVQDAPSARALPAGGVGKRGHLYLDQVSFGYDPGNPVLKGITFEARVGETLALVGPTGAGKTTIISLILRLFDPWQGRVLLDGIDLRQIKLSSLRSQIALVSQEPFLHPISVAENIRYSRPEASREEIVEAAIAARADEFIERLPNGYDTIIGQRGTTLSGGEKQRLAIARALLKNAPILLLDEPTSALDAETETLLLEALENLVVGRTTLLIAHRLSTIRQADLIVAIDDGIIAEMGPAEALLVKEGLYHQLYLRQFLSLPEKVER